MNPEEYIALVKSTLSLRLFVKEFRVVEEWAQAERGYLRIRLGLENGDFVEVAEYFVAQNETLVPKRYSYQWMDSDKQTLRKRWDNVAHYPALDNFPYHLHLSNDDVVSSQQFSILEILDQIEVALNE